MFSELLLDLFYLGGGGFLLGLAWVVLWNYANSRPPKVTVIEDRRSVTVNLHNADDLEIIAKREVYGDRR